MRNEYRQAGAIIMVMQTSYKEKAEKALAQVKIFSCATIFSHFQTIFVPYNAKNGLNEEIKCQKLRIINI